ncbi:MAG TPA: PfkB family carbohydrate kinase [Methylomirabilota bacterium]|nr:PfkB family carbohydrate kinase [Methylomirabilota bacterium]
MTGLPEVVCLGEALIDLVSLRTGIGLDGAPGFRKAAGGAPANVAVGAARLGRRAAFLGSVGDEPLGRFLTEQLARYGVDVGTVVRLTDRQTALAFVSLRADGDRDFLFHGTRPAHLGLRLTSAMRERIRHARVFHFGSISLIADPSRRATLTALREARAAGVFCSYDPNLRRDLWPDARTARRRLREVVDATDCVKVNAEELRFMTGETDLDRGLRALTRMGPSLVVATLGPAGCAYAGRAGEGQVPGFPAKAIDTTGAGDAFVAAMLVGLLEDSDGRPLAVPDRSALEAILAFANATAALSTERRGGIPSLPGRRRVSAFLRAHGAPTLARQGA